MGSEPTALFLYGDASIAARSVRQAIYDGPFDILGYALAPVILESVPDRSNEGIVLEPVQVQPGSVVVDANGAVAKLSEGVSVMPTGCGEVACARTFSGIEPLQMDQMVVRFRLLPGIQWSDGVPLRADDSVFSYEIARGLYPNVRADLIVRTASYQALDEVTVEWRGLPGYRSAGAATYYFTPLPRHAWGNLTLQELLAADAANRSPIGWGPYVIEEWTPGDHISLLRNPNYFRRVEGKPYFDRLVFRFVPDKEQAVLALSAGECDYLDESLAFEPREPSLLDLQTSGRGVVAAAPGAAWEHIDFGITPYAANPEAGATGLPPFFQLKQTRQAIAMCIDRQRIVHELFLDKSSVPDSYVPPSHPFYNPKVKQYAYDPQAASALLETIGWKDHDGNPATPRLAQGVASIQDGTPFEFAFLTTDDQEKQNVAQIIQESLAQCGVGVRVESRPWEELFAPGPVGPVFSRNFSMAQFGWATALEPPCFLYATWEIPGPYPEFPKGWGGANASGFSQVGFDQACQQALFSLADMPEHRSAHDQAQEIFADELPAIPLYLRTRIVVTRPDMCAIVVDPSADSVLWNVESFNYGETCPQ